MGFGTRPNVINWSQPLGEGGRARALPLGGVPPLEVCIYVEAWLGPLLVCQAILGIGFAYKVTGGNVPPAKPLGYLVAFGAATVR